jgi:imidazolonepropionase-like amidohydrolase
MNQFVFENGIVFDGVSPEPLDGDIVVADGVIKDVGKGVAAYGASTRIDLKGRFVMPGLIDAHVHAYYPEIDGISNDRLPTTMIAHHAGNMLRGMLARGFTSVRDTGGADHGLFLALERGWLQGPRLFYCGTALSQTGGHGDRRRPGERDLCACDGGYSGHVACTVDGVENIRLAIRERLRKGAHFIKIMGSGGVSTPADPLHCSQYSADEVAAAIDETERHDTYVTAHLHPDAAIRRYIDLGVRCIEHGTLISEQSAELAAKTGTVIVPTLAIIKLLARSGAELGFPPSSMAKLSEIEPLACIGLERMKRAGVTVGFGTDLLGPLHVHQCTEFTLRREVFSPFEILRSATSVNASILRQGHRLGRIAAGYVADLIVVEGNPLQDLSCFTEDGGNLAVIMKNGSLMKMNISE